MIKYLAGVGALALMASPLIAQDQEEPVEGESNFGTTVRELAKSQRDAETKGIGAEVSAQAKARAEERRAARGEDDGEDDADEATAEATEDSEEEDTTGRANANEGSAAALAENVAAGGADNAGVKDNEGAVAELRAARSGREFGAEARGAAADARASAADGRQIAADARAAAAQAREQAQTIRDTVRNARPGRGG